MWKYAFSQFAQKCTLCVCVLCVKSRDCAQLGPPPQGEVVQVRWTDGLVYGAKFVAAHVIQMYLVRLIYVFTPPINSIYEQSICLTIFR